MDGICGSSCESTINAFEWHSYVKMVGENTAGCVHFGNIGYILLPNSRIEVQIPTQYSEYFDHRFIEKVGISPDIKVPAGQDAYAAAKRIISGR
jgi:C-terminal processing protease CtpA/Prc